MAEQDIGLRGALHRRILERCIPLQRLATQPRALAVHHGEHLEGLSLMHGAPRTASNVPDARNGSADLAGIASDASNRAESPMPSPAISCVTDIAPEEPWSASRSTEMQTPCPSSAHAVPVQQSSIAAQTAAAAPFHTREHRLAAFMATASLTKVHIPRVQHKPT